MSNFNTCEREHGDPEGFFREIAIAAAERHAPSPVGNDDIRLPEPTFSLGALVGLYRPLDFTSMVRQPLQPQLIHEQRI